MTPRGKHYLFAASFGMGLYLWQICQLVQRLGVGVDNPKSVVMQRQLVESLLDVPGAFSTLIAFFLFGLIAHLLLAMIAIGIYRQATSVVLRSKKESMWLAVVFVAMLMVLSMIANKWLFPLSSAFADVELIMVQPLSPVFIGGMAVIGISALGFALVGVFKSHFRTSASVSAAVAIGLVVGFSGQQHEVAGERSDPDIIILGVDSLRPDFVSAYGHFPSDLMPNINAELAPAVILDDARTPLARTFVSYMSLLTGNNPLVHGARFNLYPRSKFDRRNTMAWALKEQGYSTMLAMDESRFANFDSTFGFDVTVVPRVGALDFVIGGGFDLMATNLLTAILPAIEPLSYIQGNRAAYRSYRNGDHPDKVVNALRDADPSKPLFLISHLCLPHWPYVPGGLVSSHEFSTVLSHPGYEDSPTQYLRALAYMDEQFGVILNELKRQGRLSNAIVVVMSDHGEDFSLKRDLLREIGSDGISVDRGSYGHGSFALSESQSHVVMSIQRYRGGEPLWPARRLAGAASLIDVAPTIADLASKDLSAHEGISWRKALESGADLPKGRIRYFENGLRSTGVERAHIDENKVATEMAYLYEIRPDLRFEIREAVLPAKLAEKQRGALLGRLGVMTDPAVQNFGGAGDCWRAIDFDKKSIQCVGFPALDPDVAKLQAETCRYFERDGDFSERWCKSSRPDVPWLQTAKGVM